MTDLLPLTKACAGQPDLDALREEINWLGAGVLVGQHPMRAWEYGLAVRALQTWATSSMSRLPDLPVRVLDVGGAGSAFGPTLQEKLGPVWVVEEVDPKTTGALEDRQGPVASAILCISTIEHVPDPSRFLQALSVNVASGGLIFLTMDGIGDEGPDTHHFHWMRERIYSPGLWSALAAHAMVYGLYLWGGQAWTYHGDHVYDYSFFSLCLRKV